MTSHEQAWTTLLENEALRRPVLDADARLRDLLAQRGWPESLADSMTPLFLDGFFSSYAHVGIGHPGAQLPYEEDMPGPFLLEHGLILFGYCPNGDSIAMRAVDRPGTVVYVSHEEFDYDDLSNLPEITRDIAESVSEYLLALNDETAPLDYYDEGGDDEAD